MKPAISFAFFLTAACGVGVHSEPELLLTSDGGSGGDASTPGGVPAACAQAQGPLHRYTEKAELDQLVVGKWLRCSGPALLLNADDGIEFLADGTYYGLVVRGSSLVRQTGFDEQGTWDSYQATPAAVQFNWHPSPNSGFGGFPQFEDSPRRMEIDITMTGDESVYILAE